MTKSTPHALQWYFKERRITMNVRSLIPNRGDLIFPFEQHFNQLFDDFFSDFGKAKSSLKARVNYPKMDIFSTGNEYTFQVSVPGLTEDDISVEVTEDQNKTRILKISGKMSDDYESEESNYHLKELRRSSFSRAIVLPDELKGDPDATLKNGILELKWVYEPVKVGPETKKISIKRLDDQG